LVAPKVLLTASIGFTLCVALMAPLGCGGGASTDATSGVDVAALLPDAGATSSDAGANAPADADTDASGSGDAEPQDDAALPDAVAEMDAGSRDASGSGVGTACTGSTPSMLSQGTCTVGQICLPAEVGFVGGYCTVDCTQTGLCPPDSLCVNAGGPSFCFLSCQSTNSCRAPDYDCLLGICQPIDNGSSVTPGTNQGMACVRPVLDPPGTGSLFGPSVKVSESAPANRIAAECEVAVDPRNHHVAIAYNDFEITTQFSKIGVAVSDDDGLSFRPPLQLPIDRAVDMNTAQSDPVVVADVNGNFYISWIGLDPGPMGPSNMNVYVARSSDGGHTFAIANATLGSPGLYDKPWLSVSPLDSSLLLTWTDIQLDEIHLALSSTGAFWSVPFTLSEPRSVARNLAQSTIAADGRGFITWFEIGPTQQSFGSRDNAVYLQRFSAANGFDGLNVRVTGGTDSPAFDDPSIAVFGQNVYVGFISGDATGAWDVRVATSTDGGSHFSASVKVNDDPVCATHFHHQIAVDGMGHVHALWYDNRYLTGNVFHAVSPPAAPGTALHFGPSSFVNDTAFTFYTRRDVPGWLGDYLGVAIVGSSIYASWTDNRTTNQGQIYFSKGVLP
jgi:hypothetical protein